MAWWPPPRRARTKPALTCHDRDAPSDSTTTEPESAALLRGRPRPLRPRLTSLTSRPRSWQATTALQSPGPPPAPHGRDPQETSPFVSWIFTVRHGRVRRGAGLRGHGTASTSQGHLVAKQESLERIGREERRVITTGVWPAAGTAAKIDTLVHLLTHTADTVVPLQGWHRCQGQDRLSCSLVDPGASSHEWLTARAPESLLAT